MYTRTVGRIHDKRDNLEFNVSKQPKGEITQRVKTAVHDELDAEKNELLPVLRRWWAIAVGTAVIVWSIAGYLSSKANAKDLEPISESIDRLEYRVTILETLKNSVDRIESQVYQLALHAGARVVTTPSPSPSPPLR